jgi:hypothetical protein
MNAQLPNCAPLSLKLSATQNCAGHGGHASAALDGKMPGLQGLPARAGTCIATVGFCFIFMTSSPAGTLGIEYDSVDVALTAHRPLDEARIEDISYVVTIGTSAGQDKLDLLHKNLIKFGTIFNTVKSGTKLSGEVGPAV